MTDWQVREPSVEDIRYLPEMCEDDSGSRASTPELESQSEALFVVQVWGSLIDCAVPGLSINGDNFEVTFTWNELFSQFFREKKVVNGIYGSKTVIQCCFPQRLQLIDLN